MQSQASPKQGWISQLASKINMDSFLNQFNLSTVYVITLFTYFAGGVLAGFIAKRYLKALIITLLLFFLFLKGLEFLNVTSISFNWSRIKELTGIAPSDTVGDIFRHYAAWVQEHLGETIAAVIGFIIGIKLG